MSGYRLSIAAERDIEDILRDTIERWGWLQARADGDGLHRTFEALAAAPDLGRRCDDIRPGYRRYGFGRHAIFYVEIARGVSIVRVLHGRMDVRRHLRRGTAD